MLETLWTPVVTPVNPDAPQLSTEQGCPPSLDLSSTQIQAITNPAATSSPQKETAAHQDGGGTVAPPLLSYSASLWGSFTSDEVAKPDTGSGFQDKQTDAAGKSDSGQEPAGEAEVDPVPAQQPLELRKDKLALLRKLGLDPPPVVKLRSDEGAFVQLEPAQLNPGR